MNATYPSSLLKNSACQLMNDGLVIMRIRATQNMFKQYYKVDPTQLQMITSFIFLPHMFRVVMGIIIDAKLLSKRKYYLVFMGLVATACQVLLSMYWIKDV